VSYCLHWWTAKDKAFCMIQRKPLTIMKKYATATTDGWHYTCIILWWSACR